jgi:hypothetical protein
MVTGSFLVQVLTRKLLRHSLGELLMFAPRLRAVALALGVSVTLGACAYDDYGYGYGGIGYGAGYYDDYYDGYGYGGGYGYGYPSYYGWFDGFYYPGIGIYVYDRSGHRHRWSDRHRRYWEGRRGSNWSHHREQWDGYRGGTRTDRDGNWSRPPQGATGTAPRVVYPPRRPQTERQRQPRAWSGNRGNVERKWEAPRPSRPDGPPRRGRQH